MSRIMFGAVASVCLSISSVSVAAQSQLPPAADAEERALLPEIGDLMGGGQADLPRLDALLARLPRPTALRGVVQLARGIELEKAQRSAEAVAAAREAVRFLPDWPMPKMLLSALLTFSGQPREASDLWLEASRQSPDVARESDNYILNALIGRLVDLGDRVRADALRARMAEIGLVASLTPDRSEAAVAQVYQATAKKDVDGAALALADVSDPRNLAQIWVDKRFEALWPSVEKIGGPALTGAHLRYFMAVRREWQQRRTFETATNYARLLIAARRYDSVVTLFKPLLDQAAADEQDPHLWFLAPVVARSLTEIGREDEGRALLKHLPSSRPEEKAMRLNATGNLANLSYLSQRWAAAAAESAEWLGIAKELGPEINRSAVIAVAAVHACALTKLGRVDDAAPWVANILLEQRAIPAPALTYRLCTGDIGGARKLVIDRLADETSRPWALDRVQPAGPAGNLPEEIAESNLMQQVRRDPKVASAVAGVGRILKEAVAIGVPPGFDPEAIDPTHRPKPDSI